MDLADLIDRPRPVPWSEGSKIPWHEPAFSARMLREHLSQEHDRASRRIETIDHHVAWIHESVLRAAPARVLDLGCGPGLYTTRLARLGHACTGVDFSPASIAHARAEAEREGLPCDYLLDDLRTCRPGGSFQAVLLISGELNTFSPDDARTILAAARARLAEPGALVLEVHTESAVRDLGTQPDTWSTATESVFADTPQLWLREGSWHPECRTAVERYFVIEPGADGVVTYTSTTQAYFDAEYDSMLAEAGFDRIERFPSLDGGPSTPDDAFFVLVARI